MRIIKPRIADLILWNAPQTVLGFMFGWQPMLAAMIIMFFGYLAYFIKNEFNEDKSTQKHIIITWTVFAFLNLLLLGNVGFGLTLQSMLYFYMLFYLMIPLVLSARKVYLERKERGLKF